MDYQDRSSVAQDARVTRKRDLVVSPNLLKWAAEGKIFEAGFGLEDTAPLTAGILADTTVTFSLQAPASTTLIVVPILLKIALTDDGGALTNYQVCFTKPAGLCDTSLTLSGTAMTSKHSLYRTNPAQTAQQATTLYTVTASTLIAVDYVSYHRGHVIDAVLTTGLVALGDGPSNVHMWRFLKDGVPYALTSGAAMLVYGYNPNTDARMTCYMQWAELEEDDLF